MKRGERDKSIHAPMFQEDIFDRVVRFFRFLLCSREKLASVDEWFPVEFGVSNVVHWMMHHPLFRQYKPSEYFRTTSEFCPSSLLSLLDREIHHRRSTFDAHPQPSNQHNDWQMVCLSLEEISSIAHILLSLDPNVLHSLH